MFFLKAILRKTDNFDSLSCFHLFPLGKCLHYWTKPFREIPGQVRIPFGNCPRGLHPFREFTFREFTFRKFSSRTLSLSGDFLSQVVLSVPIPVRIFFPCGHCSFGLHSFRKFFNRIFFSFAKLFITEKARGGLFLFYARDSSFEKSTRPCYFDSFSGFAFGKTLKSNSW